MSSSNKRHLVFFADPDYYGGAETYLAILAEFCPRENWRLSALLPYGDGSEVLAQKFTCAGVEIHRFKLRPALDPRLWFALAGQLRRIGGDVLHMNLPSVYCARRSLPGLIAKLVGYKRVVTTEHLPMIPSGPRSRIFKKLVSPALDAIIVHTDWNRRNLANVHLMPHKKIVIIPNGSSEAPAMAETERNQLRNELGIAPGEVALAMVGSLIERKGQHYLFEAMSELASTQTPWRILVAGEGEMEQTLKRMATELNLEDRINFLGFRMDIRRIIHASDLLVLPSTIESQPLSITEAMASALPVVATAIYGVPETVENGKEGFLVPPTDVPPLRDALRKLIDDGSLRRQMGTAARARFVAQFTVERMVALTFGVFEGKTVEEASAQFERELKMAVSTLDKRETQG
jgi:glycosyltransferase involved in cell wall biosynthesis